MGKTTYLLIIISKSFKFNLFSLRDKQGTKFERGSNYLSEIAGKALQGRMDSEVRVEVLCVKRLKGILGRVTAYTKTEKFRLLPCVQ